MKTTGKLLEVVRHKVTGKLCLYLEIDDEPLNQLNKLISRTRLEIEIKGYSKLRSRDANALLWACIGDIAQVTNVDKWEIYIDMLKHYGRFTYVLVRKEAVESFKSNWRACEEIGEVETANGEKAVQLLCYYGSHTYNTKDFSRLLDGVIQEMRNLEMDVPSKKQINKALEVLEIESGVGKEE